MGFRFFKRVNILPGVSMNFSKSGPSFSFGPRGMKYTIGPKGSRKTFGIPGTGLYYTTTSSHKKGPRGTQVNLQRSGTQHSSTQLPVSNNVKLGYFQQMLLSPQEKQLLNGLNAFMSGNNDVAFRFFQQGSALPDCAFMCGFLALGREDYQTAEGYLRQCELNIGELGKAINKINANLELLLDISEYIEAPINVDARGLGLSLVEAYQHLDNYNEAMRILERIWNSNPSDKVICLSLIDLISLSPVANKQQLHDVVDMTKTIENEEPIDTNILYLRAYALYRLNLVDAAIAQLSGILRKKKNRPEILMLDIRYLRAQMYEELNQKAKAKKDYQDIYMKNPKYEDVAARLGIT
jgi:tetratricopeptide (TPR) repeat protein